MTKKNKSKGIGFTKVLVLLVIILVVILVLSSKGIIDIKDKKSNNNKNLDRNSVEEKLKILDLKSNSRPYAVMINNISTVWGYQSGLQDAYLVYEMIVEGGYTRLMALYKDKELDKIGSVRSSRHYFLDYALENDAIYVHFGWSPQAESDIKSLGVNNINFMSYNGYIRDKSLGLATEHTAFTSTLSINEGIKKYNYRTTSQGTLLDYSVNPVDLSSIKGATSANKINIVFSNNKSTTFEYDSINKVYKRFQNNIEHKDYVTGNQYTAKNIITYKIKSYTINGDDKGRQTLDNIGKGAGWYISEGIAIPIVWEKTSRSSKTIYRYSDGTEIKVNDGNTYIEIQPDNQSLTIE